MKKQFDIASIAEKLYDTEQEAIASGVVDSVDELTDFPTLWLSLQPQHDLSRLTQRLLSVPSLEPYNQLAGLLVSLLKNTLPEEYQLQGCSILTKDNTFHFCISGLISSDDLQKCLEQYKESLRR